MKWEFTSWGKWESLLNVIGTGITILGLVA